MKLAFKVGDKVEVTAGKFAGKKSDVVKIDKRNNRVLLKGLKTSKIKTKAGSAKELHGSFHYNNLKLVKEEKPKKEEVAEQTEQKAAAKKETQPEATATEKTEEKAEETKE